MYVDVDFIAHDNTRHAVRVYTVEALRGMSCSPYRMAIIDTMRFVDQRQYELANSIAECLQACAAGTASSFSILYTVPVPAMRQILLAPAASQPVFAYREANVTLRYADGSERHLLVTDPEQIATMPIVGYTISMPVVGSDPAFIDHLASKLQQCVADDDPQQCYMVTTSYRKDPIKSNG